MRNYRFVLAMVLLASLSVGCGGDDDKSTPTDVEVEEDAGVDAGEPDSEPEDVGPPLTLKWEQLIPDSPNKLTAAAVIPGEPGRYVLVGEASTVLLYDGGAFKDISPDNVGTVNLTAAWAESADSIVVAGEGSTLITWDGSSWQVAGSVPPTPVVNFRSVHGAVGGQAWAVGDGGEAWRREAGVWSPAAVTATSGAGLADKPNFVAVQVTKDAGVWIAADGAASGSGGVVLRSDGDKKWKGLATEAAPQDLWVAKDSAKDAPVAYVVGGTTDAYAARLGADGFVSAGDVKWSLGLRSVGGLGAGDVWLGGLKGQVRRWQGDAWEVVVVAPPPGTVGGFPQPSKDVLSLALHGPEELMFVTGYKLYRYGRQP